jgi:hypothetical protein
LHSSYGGVVTIVNAAVVSHKSILSEQASICLTLRIEGSWERQQQILHSSRRVARQACNTSALTRVGSSLQVPLGRRSATPGSELGTEGGDESSEEEAEEEEEEVIEVPEVEWWDKALLPNASYTQDVEPAVEAGQPVALKENKVWWVQAGARRHRYAV